MTNDFNTNILTIFAIHIAILIIPGQNFLLVVMQTLKLSKTHGILTALGITLGTITHIFLSIFGLATLILEKPSYMQALKYMGGLYFTLLGLKQLFSKTKLFQIKLENKNSHTNDYLYSLITGYFFNLLSPRAFLYLLGLFTTILSKKPTPWHLKTYVFEVIIITFTWFSIVAFFTDYSDKVKNFFQKKQKKFSIFYSLTLFIFGVAILLS